MTLTHQTPKSKPNAAPRRIVPESTPPLDHKPPPGAEDDEVLQAGWESFPASDPPAWRGSRRPDIVE